MRSARLILPILLTALGCLALGQSNVPPKVSLKFATGKAQPSTPIKGTLTVTFADGLHGYQNPPSEKFMIPVTVTSNGGVKLVRAAYPKGVSATVGGSTTPVKVYEGTIQIPVVLLAPAKPGAYTANLSLKYQQCTENTCFPPSTVAATGKLVVGSAPPKAPGKAVPTSKRGGTQAKGAKGKKPQPATRMVEDPHEVTQPLKAGGFSLLMDDGSSSGSSFQLIQNNTQTPAPPTTSDESWLAKKLREAFVNGNYSLVVLIALLTGLALAVTPCVYPMIPVTVSFFSSQTAGNRGARLLLGLLYMLGLAITYGAVGGISAALGGTIGSLFGSPWFLFALGVIMTVLALSMFDVYEIRIPQFLGRQIHGRQGAVGALIMGLLMGFAAAPCAGPVVTVFAAKAAEIKSVPVGLAMFISIGIGLGLPFFALGAFATGAKSMPRAGAWLKTLKALLGLVVLGVALNYFLQAFQFRSGEPRTLLIQATFFVAAAVYLFVFEKSGTTQAIMGMKGIAILLCGIWAGQALQERNTYFRDQELAKYGTAAATKVDWQPFTVEAFDKAKASGKAIVIDASADWCIACHEIDDAVFKQPAGIAAMRDVVALRIDHSSGVDEKYVAETSKLFDIKGLPYIRIMKPGGETVKVITGKNELDTPMKLQEYLRQAGAGI